MGLANILTGMSILVNNEYIRRVTALFMSSKQQYMMSHTRRIPIKYQYTWPQFLSQFPLLC